MFLQGTGERASMVSFSIEFFFWFLKSLNNLVSTNMYCVFHDAAIVIKLWMTISIPKSSPHTSKCRDKNHCN